MNEDVRRSRIEISRRRALSAGATLSLASLLAACTSSGNGAAGASGSSAVPAAPGTTPATTPGTRAAAGTSASSAGGPDAASLLTRARTCVLAVQETQGPYWFDVDTVRRDIREKRPGTRLELAVRVLDSVSCDNPSPVAKSVVEIWHCDAGGVYSGFAQGSQAGPGGGGPGGPPPTGGAPGGGPGGPQGGGTGSTSNGSYSKGDQEATTTDDGTYLRGAQVAGADGIVRFTTIYPGWYRGRTTHIHLKVHVDKRTVLTTQLFFDEKVNAAVYATTPYDEHRSRDTFNDGDSIYRSAGLVTAQKANGLWLAALNVVLPG